MKEEVLLDYLTSIGEKVTMDDLYTRKDGDIEYDGYLYRVLSDGEYSNIIEDEVDFYADEIENMFTNNKDRLLYSYYVNGFIKIDKDAIRDSYDQDDPTNVVGCDHLETEDWNYEGDSYLIFKVN